MPKRTNTHIYKYATKTGKQFYGFKIYLGINPLTGKKVERTRGRFDSYAAADREYKAMAAAGIQTEYDDNMTVEDLYAKWFEVHKHSVKPITQYTIKSLWKNHIKPQIGNYRVNKATPQVMQDYANKLPEHLVNYKLTLSYVKAMFRYAVSKGFIDSSPMDHVDTPVSKIPNKHTGPKFYEHDQLTEFLQAAKKAGIWPEMFFTLVAMSGMRRGEALALRWDDLDTAAMTISVTKTVTTDENGKQTLGPTKNSVRRVIPLNAKLLPLLRRYRLQSIPGKYIFRTVAKDKPLTRQYIDWQLRNVYATLEPDSKLPRITTHGLRHTFASLVFESNPEVTPKDMQNLLGDETMRVVMEIYVHATKEGRDRTRQAVNSLNIL